MDHIYGCMDFISGGKNFEKFDCCQGFLELHYLELCILKLLCKSSHLKSCLISLSQEVNEAFEKLKQLALRRQERLFGAHEIQNFFR